MRGGRRLRDGARRRQRRRDRDDAVVRVVGVALFPVDGPDQDLFDAPKTSRRLYEARKSRSTAPFGPENVSKPASPEASSGLTLRIFSVWMWESLSS